MPAFCIATATSVTLVRLYPTSAREIPASEADQGPQIMHPQEPTAHPCLYVVQGVAGCCLLHLGQLKLDQQCSKGFRALHRLKRLETTMRDPDTRELGRQNTRSESRRQLQWLCATMCSRLS